jgi:hypothetical protein
MSNEVKTNALAVIEELGLSLETVFIPWSSSRSAGQKQPSLNWKIKLLHKGRRVLETDYTAGCAHCPAYKQAHNSLRMTINEDNAVRSECQTGTEFHRNGKPILPDTADVIYSLVSDSEAADYGDFESWANDMGYDTDSRQAERTYNDCLKIGLKLKSAIGQDGLDRLREAFQDY